MEYFQLKLEITVILDYTEQFLSKKYFRDHVVSLQFFSSYSFLISNKSLKAKFFNFFLYKAHSDYEWV